MFATKRSQILMILILGIVFISGCGEMVQIYEDELLTQIEPTVTVLPNTEPAPTNTLIPTEEPTLTPTIVPTPTATPKPPWTWHDAGNVNIPIVLFHHIDEKENGEENRYYVAPDEFERQMQILSELGFETVTVDYLVEVIRHGGLMPEKPLVITFDDGQLSVYENAFPIMEKYDFIGTMYLVASWVGLDGLMTPENIVEMVDAGWSVGSHSYSHKNLVEFSTELHHEIRMSKLELEDELGVEVNTFAYPFGVMDEYAGTKVQDYGYSGAVGLGTQTYQGLFNLFYLTRIEIFGDISFDEILEIINK